MPPVVPSAKFNVVPDGQSLVVVAVMGAIV
jgi:hypothetical protein